MAAGAFVARHPVNLGQGAALATGIRFALFRGASHVVTFDSDGQHSSDDAWNLLQTQIETGCDVVLGSRFLGSTTGMPPMRGLLLKCALAFTKFTTGLALTDVHNGLRVFTREAATKLAIRQNRMAHASEILSEIARKQLSYVEAPCTIRYTEYSKRKGQKWTAMFIILKDLFVARLHR